MKIDHVVQLVEDLDQAVANWKEMGFTVLPGGVHAGGLTHNALVVFRDGSYIELIAFRTASSQNHHWARFRGFWGPVDYAISAPNLVSYVGELMTHGLPYANVSEGGRRRPDGIELQWRSSIPTDDTHGLPFFIDDVTDRALRVPIQAANVVHTNGASGIAQIRVYVSSIDVALGNFEALFGKGNAAGNTMSFELQGSRLCVTQPVVGSAEALFLAKRGAGPMAVTIAAPVPIIVKPSAL